VTILSVLSSPITQQVIEYPLRFAVSTTAAAVSTPAVKSWAFDAPKGTRLPATAITASILNGFLTSVSSPTQQLDVACPTGTCTFPPFNSLAVCLKTANITHKLQVEEGEPNPDGWPMAMLLQNVTREFRVDLGNGCNFTAPSTMAIRVCNTQHNDSYAFKDDADLMAAKIYSFPVIYSMFDEHTFDNRSDPGPVRWAAVEAFFHLCVRTHNVSVIGGKTRTEPLTESWMPPANNTNTPLGITCNELSSLEPIQCDTPEEDMGLESGWIALADPEKPNSMDQNDYYKANKLTLDTVIDPMHYTVLSMYMYDPIDNSDNGWAIGSGNFQFIEALYNNNDRDFNGTLPLDPFLQYDRLEIIFDNVATTLTNM
jgi:hypothetical protein